MNLADDTMFRPCVLIPVYNHVAVLEQLLAVLRDKGLAVVLVNDGSDAQCRQVIERLSHEFAEVHLVTHEQNRGKGAALKSGLFDAYRLNFTHALQIDADGQHDTDDIEHFMKQARIAPRALIAGYPAYDKSVPKARYYGRYASHVWVWINTLSTTIIDSMCGFRVYPLMESCALLARCHTGNRMDFDGEFIVRWHWAGHPLVQVQTRVTYPPGGISHFRLLHDNALISWMHARLFFLMIPRLPKLLARKFHKVVPKSS